jgi:hypothetical protein
MIRRGLKAKSNRSFFIPLLLSSTAFSWKMKNLRQCVSRKSHQQQQHHEEMRNYFVVTPSLPSFMEGVLSSGDLGTRYAGTLNTWPDPCFQWRHDLKETYTQQPSSTEEGVCKFVCRKNLTVIPCLVPECLDCCEMAMKFKNLGFLLKHLLPFPKSCKCWTLPCDKLYKRSVHNPETKTLNCGKYRKNHKTQHEVG